MLNMILPFETRARCARDREYDELIDRARERAFEFQKKSQLLDPTRELGMIQQRDVRPAEALAVCFALHRDCRVQRLCGGWELRGVHGERAHQPFLFMI